MDARARKRPVEFSENRQQRVEILTRKNTNARWSIRLAMASTAEAPFSIITYSYLNNSTNCMIVSSLEG